MKEKLGHIEVDESDKITNAAARKSVKGYVVEKEMQQGGAGTLSFRTQQNY